ncbi:MAG: hypothetical protein AAFR96_08070 [Planctomycetota bacterium]
MIAALALVSAATCGLQPELGVTLRDGRGVTIQDAVVSGSGVTGQVDGGRVSLTWDTVAGLVGADDSSGGTVHTEYGMMLWRGIARLERGDPFTALGPLSDGFEYFRPLDGETAAVAAEALAATLIATGRHTRAVIPWLERTGRPGPLPGGARLQIDRETQLLPALPPIFEPAAGPARSAVADIAGQGFVDWAAGRQRRLAELYCVALLVAAGESPPVPVQGDGPGEALVHAVVASQAGTPEERVEAVAALQGFLNADPEPWRDAWSHAAIGRALLADDATALAGVGHLLMAADLAKGGLPSLAGTALADASEALDSAGYPEQAIRTAERLRLQAPLHPSLRRPGIRTLLAAASNQAQSLSADGGTSREGSR